MASMMSSVLEHVSVQVEHKDLKQSLHLRIFYDLIELCNYNKFLMTHSIDSAWRNLKNLGYAILRHMCSKYETLIVSLCHA